MPKIRIALAFQSPIIRLGLKALCEQYDDLEVIGETENKQAALSLIERKEPDLLLTGLVLQDNPSTELISSIKDKSLATESLILSRYVSALDVLACLDAGAKGYIVDREPIEKVVEAIHTVVKGEMCLSSEITINLVEYALHRPAEDDKLSNLPEKLTSREEEVLRVVATGKTNAEISTELGIAEHTVRYHLRNVYQKLNVRHRGEAILWAVRHGLWKD
jgi:NarL family two-component system response regulator YdfI